MDTIKSNSLPVDVSGLDLSNCGFAACQGLLLYYCTKDGTKPYYIVQDDADARKYAVFEMPSETFDTSKPAAISSQVTN